MNLGEHAWTLPGFCSLLKDSEQGSSVMLRRSLAVGRARCTELHQALGHVRGSLACRSALGVRPIFMAAHWTTYRACQGIVPATSWQCPALSIAATLSL